MTIVLDKIQILNFFQQKKQKNKQTKAQNTLLQTPKTARLHSEISYKH